MRNLIRLLITVLVLSSCHKESEDVPQKKNLSYMPLNIGNYWVYQNLELDSLGNTIKMFGIDSVCINRDTILNGLHFYVIEGTRVLFNINTRGIMGFLRDSSGYIKNYYGNIIFSEDNFSDILGSDSVSLGSDQYFKTTCKMEKVNSPITVPAGTFEALNFQGTVMLSVEIPGIENPRYVNQYYAKNVGVIKETSFYLLNKSKTSFERSLLRYHIQE